MRWGREPYNTTKIKNILVVLIKINTSEKNKFIQFLIKLEYVSKSIILKEYALITKKQKLKIYIYMQIIFKNQLCESIKRICFVTFYFCDY